MRVGVKRGPERNDDSDTDGVHPAQRSRGALKLVASLPECVLLKHVASPLRAMLTGRVDEVRHQTVTRFMISRTSHGLTAHFPLRVADCQGVDRRLRNQLHVAAGRLEGCR